MISERTKKALEIAQEAGKFAFSRCHSVGKVETKSSLIDVVTEVDKETQHLIARQLNRSFPKDLVWGEESGYPLEDFSSTWVIDPIDGTSNYIHGLPFYAISMAYFRGGKPSIGVIYAPVLKELFFAEEGQGAFLNGEPIRVSPVDTWHQAIVGTGFPHDEKRWAFIEPLYARLLTTCQALRAMGSAALGVAYVACGRLDGYVQLGISFYDVAAGICLVREAKGTVSDLWGKEWTFVSRSLWVTNGVLDLGVVKGVLPEETPVQR
ncbi:MAG: inositol monophosphatase family protein [Atribacterota bacterium]